jgi:TP901 family phage tail tape measure protein
MGAKVLIDIVMRGANLATAQMGKLGNTFSKAGAKLGKFGKVAGAVSAVALLAIGKGIQVATKEFINFNDKMTQSLAIMDTTIAEQKAMEEQALAVSRTTKISAEQSAEAYFFLASAGLNAEQSISALPQVAKFAQAGMFDMATATDLATDAQSALGLTVDDAQANLNNLTRVTDVLVKANTLANASVQQFSEALTNKAGSALKVANKGIEEGVAVLSAFADRGVKGAEAGEKLNQLLRDIPRATAKNGEEFKKLNLQMFDSQGNMKNVADLIEELDRVLAPMSDELKASTFSELGIVVGEIVAPALASIVGGITKVVQKITGMVNKFKEWRENVKNTTDEIEYQIYGLETSTRTYDKYSQKVEETAEAISAVGEEAMFQAQLNQELTETIEALVNAHKKLADMQEEIADLEKDRNKALKKVTKAEDELTKATSKVENAEDELAKQKVLSTQVTLTEELAILKQKEALRKLEEQEDRTEIQELELALAKQKLTELIEASTGATNEEESAQRALEQALKDQERAQENLTRAQDRLTEAQNEFNKATAQTPENLMKIAMAKAELDKAIADIKALGTFEEALSQMVNKTGIELDRLRGMFNNLMSGQGVPSASTGTGGGNNNAGAGSSGGDVFDNLGNAGGKGTFSDFAKGSALGKFQSGNQTLITVNTGNLLGTPEEIQDAVATAIVEAKRRGIVVAV